MTKPKEPKPHAHEQHRDNLKAALKQLAEPPKPPGHPWRCDICGGEWVIDVCPIDGRPKP